MKLLHPSLFTALHDAVLSLGRGRIPVRCLPAGTMALRIVDRKYVPAGPDPVDSTAVAGNLVVRDTRDDRNRFTGVPPRGSAAAPAGGVYFSLDPRALRNEALTYAKAQGAAHRDPRGERPEDKGRVRLRPESDSPFIRGGGAERRQYPDWDPTLRDRCMLHVRLTRTVVVANLDAALFLTLDRDAATRRGLVGTCWLSVAHAVASSDDHSAARALGLALHRLGLDGLQVATVRTLPGPPGENLVLFGTQGLPIPGVEVVAVDTFEATAGSIQPLRRFVASS